MRERRRIKSLSKSRKRGSMTFSPAKWLRLSSLQLLVGFFTCAVLILLGFLLVLIVRFGGSSAPSTNGVAAVGKGSSGSSTSSTKRVKAMKLPSKSTTPAKAVGLEYASKAVDVEIDDWPDQTLTIYSEPGCRGDSYVVHNTHIENRCTKCLDFCGKKYKSSGRELQGNVGSLKASGQGTVVSMWAVCKGTWKYPKGDGFLTTLMTESGCHDVNKNWPPVHIEFHMRNKLELAKISAERARGNPYANNPMTDPKKVLQRISYWKGLPPPGSITAKPATNQYITFLKDCGGFNNIRMGFE